MDLFHVGFENIPISSGRYVIETKCVSRVRVYRTEPKSQIPKLNRTLRVRMADVEDCVDDVLKTEKLKNWKIGIVVIRSKKSDQ